MARIHIANVVTNMEPLNKMVRALNSDNSNTGRSTRRAAQAYKFYLKERYLVFAGGGGNWRALSPKYKKRKPRNKNMILWLNGDLYDGIDIRKSRSKKNPGYLVGYVTGGIHYSGYTLRALANIHQNIGIERSDGVAKRKIIVLPNSATRNAMTSYIQQGVNKDINVANRSARRGR